MEFLGPPPTYPWPPLYPRGGGVGAVVVGRVGSIRHAAVVVVRVF